MKMGLENKKNLSLDETAELIEGGKGRILLYVVRVGDNLEYAFGFQKKSNSQVIDIIDTKRNLKTVKTLNAAHGAVRIADPRLKTIPIPVLEDANAFGLDGPDFGPYVEPDRFDPEEV